MKTYTARYVHDGRAWVVQFLEPDIATWGRSLRAAKGYAREALAAYLGVQDLESADAAIVDDVQLSVVAESELDRLGTLRREAETMRHQVAAETRRAAQQLRRSGLSVRDVAEILGVSAARVAQLEREPVD